MYTFIKLGISSHSREYTFNWEQKQGPLCTSSQSEPQDTIPAANQSPGTARILKEHCQWDITLQQKLSHISLLCTKTEPWKHRKNIV